jgi:putative ABC transport system permease protein
VVNRRLPLAALDRKLVRELWRLRTQLLSIALVVAAGVATVVLFRSTFDSLEASRDRYYRESRFADVFAALKRAPEPVARRLALIPGVDAVETRVVLGVTLDVPELSEPATGRLVSLPEPGAAGLNRLFLRRGRMPQPGRANEVLVSEQFALANHLALGDTLGAVINGRWERLVVVGVALSPEYVYAVSGEALITDDRRFGVLWMGRKPLAAAYAMEGAFNDVALALAPGASADAVIAAVDRVLERYGGFGAYDRADQSSNRVIEDEFRQNRVTGTLIPALILAVAAFLLNVVLGRLVRTEREQIALLKAFGYSNTDVGRHYLRYALVTVLVGAAIGIVVGMWLGQGMIGLYAQNFRFPVLRYRASWPLVAAAVLVSVVAAAAGALGAVRRAIRLPPAEAMRPEAPARFSRGWIERALPVRLTPSGRIVVRNLTRRPLRTLVSVLGVGFATSLLVVVLIFFASFRYSFDLQFRIAQRQDVTVAFNAPRGAAVRYDLAHLPGVERVEGFRAVPVRLRAGHHARQLALTGLEPAPALSRVVGADGRAHALPADGVLLSAELARVLEVAPGDTVTAEVLEGARPVLRLPVAGTVDDVFGVNAYMALPALARRLDEAPTLSGAHLRVDADRLDALNATLKQTPSIAGATSPAAMLRNFEESIARNLDTNLLIISAFAGVIAIGVIYNGARIALSEGGRELASLRVLGFTKHEVAVILLGEQAVVTALGIPVGALLGMAYASAWVTALNGETYRIPLRYPASTFILSGAIIAGMAVLAGLLVRRRLGRLDLIAVLKTRE